jgi:hypothetical protein
MLVKLTQQTLEECYPAACICIEAHTFPISGIWDTKKRSSSADKDEEWSLSKIRKAASTGS